MPKLARQGKSSRSTFARQRVEQPLAADGRVSASRSSSVHSPCRCGRQGARRIVVADCAKRRKRPAACELGQRRELRLVGGVSRSRNVLVELIERLRAEAIERCRQLLLDRVRASDDPTPHGFALPASGRTRIALVLNAERSEQAQGRPVVVDVGGVEQVVSRVHASGSRDGRHRPVQGLTAVRHSSA